jgi:peptidoglycan/LPS O-acetylase OafA/YrhL
MHFHRMLALKDSSGGVKQRFTQLDALRALAVTLVVWTHTDGRSIHIFGDRIGGYEGVVLFFVISGFLITGILLDSRVATTRNELDWRQAVRTFYVRRFLRIFPIYYAVLFLAFAVRFPELRSSIGWHLTYLSNWHFASQGHFEFCTAHLWSLAVEEQFYLIWPWFVLLTPVARLPWIIGTMILIGPISRFALGSAGTIDLAGWITTPTVLDSLGLGCLLAYAWRQTVYADWIARWAVVCAVTFEVLLKITAAFHLSLTMNIKFAISGLAWALFCMWLVHRAARGFPGNVGRMLVAPPLVHLGTISYGIYLFHPFVPYAVNKVHNHFVIFPSITGANPMAFLVVMLVTVLAASASWRFFEGPINSLRHRFAYVRICRG